ncbi:MAG: copper-containing nitrite reductase [Anaerolineae bacterium]
MTHPSHLPLRSIIVAAILIAIALFAAACGQSNTAASTEAAARPAGQARPAQITEQELQRMILATATPDTAQAPAASGQASAANAAAGMGHMPMPASGSGQTSATNATGMGNMQMPASAAQAKSNTPQGNQPAAPQQQGGPSGIGVVANVSYTLRTSIADGKLGFMGVGGDIDGKLNPTLRARPGDTVQVTLINGDGAEHDWVSPDFKAQTDKVSSKGGSSVTVFKADKAGDFVYYCSVPGHRQAGMEGKITVGDVAATVQGADISRDPADLPGPLNRNQPQNVRVDLETVELEGQLADGVTYTFWTFNGKIPGPFIRVREGDTVEVHLKNRAGSKMAHSVDFHAVTGPGGGAVATQTQPNGETEFTFKALNPGLYVYHCATPMVAHHIANGMYGLILVEPANGLPKVDHEYYVMQGEVYTQGALKQQGHQEFSVDKLLDEQPTYYIFNGSTDALTKKYPLKAKVGETVRIYFGVGGPDATSSFHVIGEIFDRVYNQASLTSAPLTNVQTTTVAPGGATTVEFKVDVPGRFILVDHALSRMERGLSGYLMVDGDPKPDIFFADPAKSSINGGGSGH